MHRLLRSSFTWTHWVRPLLHCMWMAVLAFPLAAQEKGTKDNQEAVVQKIQDQIREKIEPIWKDSSIPGMTVGFAWNDGRSGSVSVGLADKESQTALRPKDRMLAGSIGKTFVSAVALQLHEEGKLDLDRLVSHWLEKEPWFDRLPNGKTMTVRMLLHHTAGLSEYFEVPSFQESAVKDPLRERKPEELLEPILGQSPLFEAGKGWSYADTNYIVLGMILEKITGTPLFDEIDRRLLKPFQLERTIPSNRLVVPELITGYAGPRNPFGYVGRSLVDGKMLANPQIEYAGGGLASTAEDLARWSCLVYQGKVFRNPETLSKLLNGVSSESGRGGGKGSKYGLGVQIQTTARGVRYGHSGWFPGYFSEMAYYPKQGIAIAAQINTDTGRGSVQGLRAAVEAMADVLGIKP